MAPRGRLTAVSRLLSRTRMKIWLFLAGCVPGGFKNEVRLSLICALLGQRRKSNVASGSLLSGPAVALDANLLPLRRIVDTTRTTYVPGDSDTGVTRTMTKFWAVCRPAGSNPARNRSVSARAFPSTDLVKLPTSRLLARKNFRFARHPGMTQITSHKPTSETSRY